VFVVAEDRRGRELRVSARREAKTVLVGKTGPACRENEVAALMMALAKAGGHVVRLEGGGSPIFGRAAEEIAACRGAGLAVEGVPGVTVGRGHGEIGGNRANNPAQPTPIPGTPLRACCEWPAARPARPARALRSTSPGRSAPPAKTPRPPS